MKEKLLFGCAFVFSLALIPFSALAADQAQPETLERYVQIAKSYENSSRASHQAIDKKIASYRAALAKSDKDTENQKKELQAELDNLAKMARAAGDKLREGFMEHNTGENYYNGNRKNIKKLQDVVALTRSDSQYASLDLRTLPNHGSLLGAMDRAGERGAEITANIAGPLMLPLGFLDMACGATQATDVGRPLDAGPFTMVGITLAKAPGYAAGAVAGGANHLIKRARGRADANCSAEHVSDPRVSTARTNAPDSEASPSSSSDASRASTETPAQRAN